MNRVSNRHGVSHAAYINRLIITRHCSNLMRNKACDSPRLETFCSHNSNTIVVDDSIKLKISYVSIDIKNSINKSVYWHFVNYMNSKRPTACNKWQELSGDIFKWKEIFSTVTRITHTTFLQCLQFKILHRFYPYNKMLSSWYSKYDNLCVACQCEDT